MKKRALLSAIALCFLASGCDSKKAAEPPKPTTAAVVPLPPPAPTAPAASANQDATPAQVAQTAPTGKAGAPGKGNGRTGCKRNNCKVVIDVTAGTPCAKATPDKLDVFAGNKDDHIHWKVNTKDWDFASNGIEWKDSSASQQFSDGGLDGGPNTFKWKDANTDEKEYHYKIHLVNSKTKQKCDVDPSAVNGAEN